MSDQVLVDHQNGGTPKISSVSEVFIDAGATLVDLSFELQETRKTAFKP
jgi:hypothetical protein